MFPAAFGGRRTNRGIYCEPHNNAFGRHISTLLSGLDIVNAIIGVIPDRQKEIRPAPTTAEDGERYLLSRGDAKIAPPRPLNETPELVGKSTQLRFADQNQANNWIAEQKRAGFQIMVAPASPVKTQIVAKPLLARRELGNEAFMRAILYLALTFLAHGYPNLARSPGLTTARDIVEKDESVEDRVLWEPPCAMKQLSLNPFPYGHTVSIGPISNTNKIGALISLYGAIHFGIELGELAGINCSERITTHINPLAERPIGDILVTRDKGGFLVLSSTDVSRGYLHQLRTGQMINPLASVLRSAINDSLSGVCEALMPELVAVKAMSPSLRSHRIMELLVPHDQRIFNLMSEGIHRFAESATDLPTPIQLVLKSFIAANDSAPRGIDHTSEVALQLAKASLADAILARIDDDTLDKQTLAELLGGGEGIGIVLRTLTHIIADALPR